MKHDRRHQAVKLLTPLGYFVGCSALFTVFVQSLSIGEFCVQAIFVSAETVYASWECIDWWIYVVGAGCACPVITNNRLHDRLVWKQQQRHVIPHKTFHGIYMKPTCWHRIVLRMQRDWDCNRLPLYIAPAATALPATTTTYTTATTKFCRSVLVLTQLIRAGGCGRQAFDLARDGFESVYQFTRHPSRAKDNFWIVLYGRGKMLPWLNLVFSIGCFQHKFPRLCSVKIAHNYL